VAVGVLREGEEDRSMQRPSLLVVVVRVALAVLVLVALAAVATVLLVRGAGVALAFLSFAVGLVLSPAVTVIGEWVRDRVFRPDIRAVRPVVTKQAGVMVGRLLVQNEGSVRAREVEAVVERIFDGDKLRENFIGMPLRWTHGQVRAGVPSMRDIHVKQKCLLDIIQVEPVVSFRVGANGYIRTSSSRLRLCSEAGGVDESLSELLIGKSRLVIAIYDASGGVAEIQLEVNWKGGFTAPEVRIAR
jgi:uncharacterized protein (DUF58 family)